MEYMDKAEEKNICLRDKKEAVKRLKLSGVQFPGSASIPDGSVRSITDPKSKVKKKIADATKTKQYKRWLGDRGKRSGTRVEDR